METPETQLEPPSTPPLTPTPEIESLIESARTGTSQTATIIRDTTDYILVNITNTPNSLTQPQADTHTTEDGHLCIRTTPTLDWSYILSEKHNNPLVLLDYLIDFQHPKWNDFDASIRATVDIPGPHGTLQKTVKIQGFPTHRETEQNKITLWTSLRHLETDRSFFTNTEDTFRVPESRAQPTYPFTPALMAGVYQSVFDQYETYKTRLTEEFTVCERCGIFDSDDTAHGRPLREAVDPNGGWRRLYCLSCNSRVLQEEYGVTSDLAKMYIQYRDGESATTVAEQYGYEPQKGVQLIERLEAAVSYGTAF